MTTRHLSLFLALCLVPLAACKKQADSNPPDSTSDQDRTIPRDDAEPGGGGGGDVETEEILTVDAFEEKMQGHQGDVADCFGEAKEKKADLSGKLALDITVAADGSVSAVKFDESSTIKEASITSCVEAKAKTWKFPKTSDGNEMTLPYSLNLK
jgi:hypothetical protein